VARGGNEKLVRRHPHVFGGENADGHEESQVHWNAIKDAEKRAKGLDPDKESLLKDLPASSSPLRQAHSYQKDAARAGFDWPDVSGVWDKVHEELGELEEAAQGGDPARIRHEVGDLLQSVVNLSRWLGVEADDALRLGNRRFARRFRAVEAGFAKPAAEMPAAGLETLEAAWQAAKRAEQDA
jgi:tetrapyrrole methylase family protein/MazG family protein